MSAGAEAGVDEVVGIEMKAKRLKAGQRRKAGGRRNIKKVEIEEVSGRPM